MLEVSHRQGRARNCLWNPSEGTTAQTPTLIFPEVSFAPIPDWAQITLSKEPQGRKGIVELLSGGTWFHPRNEETPGLVVAAPQPAPTSLVQVLNVGEELAIFHDAGAWAGNPSQFIEPWIEACNAATPGRLLWAPALGTPQDYALYCYLGADLFDASPLYMAAAQGQALTTDGTLTLTEAEQLLGDGQNWDIERLVSHNLEAARRELMRIRHAIATGSLRALVERRIYGRPGSIELLRRFDRQHTFLETATPIHDTRDVPCMTAESLWMPEVEAYRRRIRDHYTPPQADVLVLLPCSQGKPYKTSKTHRYFSRALDDSGIRWRCHEVMITSPLGIVPRELEEIYPAHKYDVPVTGAWMEDEKTIIRNQIAALLSKRDYKHILVHTDQGTHDAIHDLLPAHAIHSSNGRPSSIENCTQLRDTLRQIRDAEGTHQDGRHAGRQRRISDMQAIASYQFGPQVAAALCKDGSIRGRNPYLKLLAHDGTQLGMTTEGRGILSLTLDGARIVAAHNTKRVHIGDFHLKGTGSLFAVGVEGADPDVRPGDDVIVVHGDEVRGCGQALMSGPEMTHIKRGVAVQVRHRT